MPGLKEIKTRIGGVTNVRQMTKAMKTVSAARLKGAQVRIVNLRDYARALHRVVADIVLSREAEHPFLDWKREIKKPLFVVVTSDRGLCAGFNGNICRFAAKLLNEGKYKNPDLFFAGKKGMEYFKFRGFKGGERLFNLTKEISYSLAARLARRLSEDAAKNNHDGIFIIYNEFKTITNPKIVCERLIPFDFHSSEFQKSESSQKTDQPSLSKGSALDESASRGTAPAAAAARPVADGSVAGRAAATRREAALPPPRNFIFEVPVQSILEDLLHRCLSAQIYRCLCESVAAEHGARMAAMENATKNAGDILDRLTLTYNKLRQSAVTTELTEIVSGAEALK